MEGTVLDWLWKAGLHCERVPEYMVQELELSQVQLDELWIFVRKKERLCRFPKPRPAVPEGLYYAAVHEARKRGASPSRPGWSMGT